MAILSPAMSGPSEHCHRTEYLPPACGKTASMASMNGKLVVRALSVVAAAAAFGQSPAREKIDVSKLGPQVGDRVPDFSLKDQTGKIQTLQSIMGPKGAMLVFLRSADW